jgi:hypothetical protein
LRAQALRCGVDLLGVSGGLASQASSVVLLVKLLNGFTVAAICWSLTALKK